MQTAGLLLSAATRWTTNEIFPQNLGFDVTKYVPHKGVELIA